MGDDALTEAHDGRHSPEPRSAPPSGWVLDGHGLPDEARQLLDADTVVHARLRDTDCSGRYPVAACDLTNGRTTTLGMWWSGIRDDVTCPRCLEVTR